MGTPKVTSEGFKVGHWREIISRLEDSIGRIRARQEAVDQGRTIPEDDHLVIGAGRHLNAAVMFLDICGFSNWPSGNFSEQTDVLTVFNLYMTEMVRIANDYGAEIEKNTGDGLLAYFDAQAAEASQDIAKRALACALAMLKVTQELINPVLQRSSLPIVNFRIGLDFGPITIARVGAARLFNSRVAIGSIANVASKMLRHGKENEVILGQQFFLKLPAGWAKHASFLTPESGFIYISTGKSYPLYKYTGRWTQLI